VSDELTHWPIPAATTDVHSGPPLHKDCRAVRDLVGVWRGEGSVDYPTIKGPTRFGQQITISHDGRPFLKHEAQAWLLDADGNVLRPAACEAGWWRSYQDWRVELLLSHNTGILELFYGGGYEHGWNVFTSNTVLCAATAKEVRAAERQYTRRADGGIDYTESRAMMGQPMTPHVRAELHRVAAGSSDNTAPPEQN
jgi:hypothetical protein